MLHLRWSINISPCNKTYTHWHIHTHTHVLRIVAAVLSRKIKWTYFLWRFPSRTFSSLRRVSHYNSELPLFGRSVAEQSFWLPCNIYYRTNWRQAFAGLKRRIPYHAWIFHGSIYWRKSFVLTRYTHIWEMYSQSFAGVPFSCFTCASVYIPSHSLPLSVSFCHAFTLIVVAAISVPVQRICFTVCLKTFQLKRRIERGKFFLDTTFRQVGAGWFNPFPLPLGWWNFRLPMPWRHASYRCICRSNGVFDDTGIFPAGWDFYTFYESVSLPCMQNLSDSKLKVNLITTNLLSCDQFIVYA